VILDGVSVLLAALDATYAFEQAIHASRPLS
jgi:hypothetical protein